MPANTNALRDHLRPLHREIAGRLPLGLRRHYLYTASVGRIGNFSRPRSFTEKVNWRILHDRRPELGEVCDKLRMKEIARERVSADRLRIPQTWWSGDRVDDIPDDLLSREFVLKPNHGSGDVVFGPADRETLRRAADGWLHSDQATRLGEWGYSQARSLLLLEELLPGERPLTDYKIFCFDGQPSVVSVHEGRFAAGHTETYYSTDWRYLPAKASLDAAPPAPRPDGLEAMLSVAADLSRGWDFIRTDFYLIDGEVWFGEFSPYPCGGVDRFEPRSFDRWLGEQWTLPNGVRR